MPGELLEDSLLLAAMGLSMFAATAELAEQLDLVVQEPVSRHYEEAPGDWPHILRRDMDVSEFSDETVNFIRKAGAFADAFDDPEAMLEKLQDPSSFPQASETVMHDILTRRNERLLGEIEAALSDYERVVVPWGALHMPWIEQQIEELGFERTDSRQRLFIDWDRILNAIEGGSERDSNEDSGVGPPGFEPGTIRL